MKGGVYERETKKHGINYYLDFRWKGERIRKMYGPSLRGAQAAIAKIKSEISENKFMDKRKEPVRVLFRDFAAEYLGWIRENRGDRPHRDTVGLLKPILAAFGDKAMDDVTTWEVEKFRLAQRKTLAVASCNRSLALIKTMYNRAILWGKCSNNPPKTVRLLKGEVVRTRVLSKEETRALLTNCPAEILPAVIFSLGTGARKSETLTLEWKDVNLSQGTATFVKTKNGEARTVPLNATVKAFLEKIPGREGRVFRKPNGEALHYTTVRKPFEKTLRTCGIQDFRWHDLRACYCTNLLVNGTDVATVKSLMGHKSLNMVMRYARISGAGKAQAVAVLDRIFDEALGDRTPEFHEREAGKKVVALSGGKHMVAPVAQVDRATDS